MKLEKLLNPPQLEAVVHRGSPLLVLAGAGSGKTRVITYRIAYLIHKHQIDPKNILGVTFTNKAANEMKQRVKSLIGAKAEPVTLSTFHSLGLKILRQHGDRLGFRKHFSIYGEGDQLSLVKTYLREHPQKKEKFDAGILLARISAYKNNLTQGGKDYPLFNDKYDLVFADIYESFQQALRAHQAVDFDDLILLPIRLFEEHTEILRYYQDLYRHILVDEYQDTNHGQCRLISLLAGKRREICVVGDDDQSIYGWRGAQVRNILQFERDYPDAKVIKLEQNYRSTQTILDAAHHVIMNNHKRQEKRLWTDRGRGKNIDAFLANDENDEAQTIAWRMETIKERTHAKWSDFAVLYRSNIQSRALESTLRVAGIPYAVVGGYEFFDRKEIKDITAYLRVIRNPRDDLSLLRIVNYPRRGIGETTIVKLTEEAQQRGTSVFEWLKQVKDDPSLSKQTRDGIRSFTVMIDDLRNQSAGCDLPALVRAAIERSGYREEIERTIEDAIAMQMKIEIVEELVSTASAFMERDKNGSLSDFIDSISLGDETNGKKNRRPEDAVLLATLHSAKGLEFPFVFLCGMEEDLLPHGRSLKDSTDVDEERRLCYVGMTRAKNHLTLSLTKERNKFGRRAKRVPSRFLKEIPEEFLCKQFSHSQNFFDKQKIESDAGQKGKTSPVAGST
ncbi:MAG: UvrD-helicase domain-containing protein [Candidatus Omnitrophota bacterium]